MKTIHKLIGLAGMMCALASCETPKQTAASFGPQMRPASITGVRRIANVRTTAYTHSEKGGSRNAVGRRLSGSKVMSAASDWSTLPLGTRFQIVGNWRPLRHRRLMAAPWRNQHDRPLQGRRVAMRRWGVRRVDIDIIEWGSKEQSLKVLAPRRKHRIIRRMIAGLEQRTT